MSAAEVRPGANVLAIISSRRNLVGSFLAGGAIGVALLILKPTWPAATTAIVSWDVVCLMFMLLLLPGVVGRGPKDIRFHAAEQDQARATILSIVLTAVAASVFAIGVQLSLAKPEHGILRTGHVALAFITVALSWMMVQVVFALHYAHKYYDENKECAGQDMKGLEFPGGDPPDYWDFLHFSIIIGVAAQTADIAITSKELRRLGTLQSMVAFAFNTVVVALTINLLAALF